MRAMAKTNARKLRKPDPVDVLGAVGRQMHLERQVELLLKGVHLKYGEHSVGVATLASDVLDILSKLEIERQASRDTLQKTKNDLDGYRSAWQGATEELNIATVGAGGTLPERVRALVMQRNDMGNAAHAAQVTNGDLVQDLATMKGALATEKAISKSTGERADALRVRLTEFETATADLSTTCGKHGKSKGETFVEFVERMVKRGEEWEGHWKQLYELCISTHTVLTSAGVESPMPLDKRVEELMRQRDEARGLRALPSVKESVAAVAKEMGRRDDETIDQFLVRVSMPPKRRGFWSWLFGRSHA